MYLGSIPSNLIKIKIIWEHDVGSDKMLYRDITHAN